MSHTDTSPPATIQSVNEMPADALHELFARCVTVSRVADTLVANRPYADMEQLSARIAELVDGLSDSEIRQALDAHPRIGELPANDSPTANWSATEQSGVDSSDTQLAERLRTANIEYERRFGHIYLVCAAGRAGQELLAELETRLTNDAITEFTIVRRELGKIAQLRLHTALAEHRPDTVTSAITTHVLDTALGQPAGGVTVKLQAATQGGWTSLGSTRTDTDGRVNRLGPEHVTAGRYRLVFDTEGYFTARGVDSFFPEVTVTFTVTDPAAHYHVPVLLSPFAVSTYRGS